MAALAYLRRLGEAANALAYAPAGPDGAAGEVVSFGERADQALDALAAEIDGTGTAIPSVDVDPPSTPDAAVNQRLAIVADVIAALDRVLARGMRDVRAAETDPASAHA
jgi:hypothetical protein